MAEKTALIIGCTGLVGEHCLTELLANNTYTRVTALSRSPLAITHNKLHNLVVDFDKPDNYKEQLKADDIYCAMGTTIGKAGSEEAFRKVDFDYPHKTAELALWNGAKRFILVSSLGADASSTIFYSRVKGELEEALKKMNYEALIILRPSILLGDRKEKRMGEAIGRFAAEKFSFLFAGPLKQYRGTPAAMVAKVMVKLGSANAKGVRVLENNEIFEEAGK
jgi:uncharacterized protein YbjT (DUF2867 family)